MEMHYDDGDFIQGTPIIFPDCLYCPSHSEWIAPTQEDILYAGKTVDYIILLVRSDSWFSCEKIKEAAYERMMWRGTIYAFRN
jgi:hypothetical protein